VDPTNQETTLVDLFDAVAARAPDAIAVEYRDTRLTYAELQRASQRMAAYLRREIRIGRGDRVAVCLDPTADLIVSLLAILRCGAAYVPLDVQNPVQRNAFIAADCRPRALVGEPGAVGGGMPTIVVDVVAKVTRTATDEAREPNTVVSAGEAHDVCYVIYTSGTTGRPKGVPVSHGNVRALFAATADLFDFTADDAWLLYHSIAFDFSVWEIWGALLHGARLVIADRWTKLSPQACAALVVGRGVTVLNQTPTAFGLLAPALQEQIDGAEPALRYVIFGGERLQAAALRPWADRFGVDRPALVNMFGLTEATVHTTYHRVVADDLASEVSVIGGPLPGFVTRIVNETGRAADRGELYVAGPQVASGYLGRPDLTAARFGPDPLGVLDGIVFYRTGDVVDRRDGLLRFVGRADRQTKIRGHRIELGEVEAAVRAVNGVAEACVLVGGPADRPSLLCGYTTRSGQPLPGRTVRTAMRTRVPQYMLPTRFQWFERMPLTVNGKVDEHSLRKEMELSR
jgi:amino acid adenylation domain-containing protein